MAISSVVSFFYCRDLGPRSGDGSPVYNQYYPQSTEILNRRLGVLLLASGAVDARTLGVALHGLLADLEGGRHLGVGEVGSCVYCIGDEILA